jgi:hypothetical protein
MVGYVFGFNPPGPSVLATKAALASGAIAHCYFRYGLRMFFESPPDGIDIRWPLRREFVEGGGVMIANFAATQNSVAIGSLRTSRRRLNDVSANRHHASGESPR